MSLYHYYDGDLCIESGQKLPLFMEGNESWEIIHKLLQFKPTPKAFEFIIFSNASGIAVKYHKGKNENAGCYRLPTFIKHMDISIYLGFPVGNGNFEMKYTYSEKDYRVSHSSYNSCVATLFRELPSRNEIAEFKLSENKLVSKHNR
jgi:hypothetical protein